MDLKILNGTTSIFDVRSPADERKKYEKNPNYVEKPFTIVPIDSPEYHTLVSEFINHSYLGTHNYLINIRHNKKVWMYPRVGMPCLGELTYYSESQNTYRPRDLWFPFPKGAVYSIVVKMTSYNGKFMKFLTQSRLSPYTRLISNVILHYIGEHLNAVILKNPDTNSDYFISFIKDLRHSVPDTKFDALIPTNSEEDELVKYLLHRSVYTYGNQALASFWPEAADIDYLRLIKNEPDSPENWTYQNGKGYRRKTIENLWGGMTPRKERGPTFASSLLGVYSGQPIPQGKLPQVIENVRNFVKENIQHAYANSVDRP